MLRDKKTWIIGYLILFFLSLDFWNWGAATPLILGMPYWVIHSLVLTSALSLYYLLFSKYCWGDADV
jgi:hypothetical protein